MIAFLNGTLVARTASAVYMEVGGGIGFEVLMPARSIEQLPEVGLEARVLTYLQVRDDGLTLYGFLSLEEKSLFEQLISVSGVGPKVALSALSFFTPQELVGAICAQDDTRVSKIPGVGKKTAQRIILELKGSLDSSMLGDVPVSSSGSSESMAASASEVQGVTEALLSMGFSSAETTLALEGAPQDASESTLLQYALKRLGSHV